MLELRVSLEKAGDHVVGRSAESPSSEVSQDGTDVDEAGDDAAATVVNNHRAKLLLSGITDAATTGELAQVLGEAEVSRHSTTVDADGRVSATHATQNEPLTSAAGLRQLRPFEGVLIYGHLPATHIRLRPSFEERQTRQASNSRM